MDLALLLANRELSNPKAVILNFLLSDIVIVNRDRTREGRLTGASDVLKCEFTSTGYASREALWIEKTTLGVGASIAVIIDNVLAPPRRVFKV